MKHTPTVVLFTMTLALLAALPAQGSFSGHWAMRTPELFGDAEALVWQVGPYVFGVVQGWGTYVMLGQAEGNVMTCQMTQLGRTVVDATEAIPCGARLRPDGMRFNGWIDFRGHARPFCGADEPGRIPTKCKGY